MASQILRCEVCWDDDEVYTPAFIIGLVGYGNSEGAVCRKHLDAMRWFVPTVEVAE
jgi:hypothetical protein